VLLVDKLSFVVLSPAEEPVVDKLNVTSVNPGKLQSEATGIFSSSPELQLIYKTAPVGLAFLSVDCRYLMINEHLTEICGLSIADHIGRSVRETVPQVADQVERIVAQIVQSGEPITGVEVNGQRADGSNVERVWITYWHPLKNNDGDVIGINVAAEEVTARKRAEADRMRLEKTLLQLNETLAERVEMEAQERERLWRLSQDLLVVADTNRGTIRNVNPAWTTTLGWTPDDLIGKPGDWLIHPEDLERSRGELAFLRRGKPSSHFENRIRCKDGSYRWLSWRSMIGDSSIYAIARDVTKLKQAEEQLYNLRSELALASRQSTLGAMTASLAHEIRQPLASVAANAAAGLRWLDRDRPDVDEARAALRRAVDDAHKIDEVITSVRTMVAKQTRGRTPLKVHTILEEALALTQRELVTRRTALQNNVRDNLPLIAVDRVQLRQVFVNLIMNAVEAMDEVNGRDRTVTLGCGNDESEITITIADNGHGIDGTKRGKIFEPFFTTKPDGMGLGLSICKSIIEAHEGRLWATANAPFGTIVHLALPLSDNIEAAY
jgi:PAS domain S-box-containing protein